MATNNRLSNNRLYQHIIQHEQLTPNERFVALTIAGHRNERDLKCCPTYHQLTRITGIKERWKLARIVGSLRHKGILGTIKLPNLEQPLRSPNQYYFTIDLEQARDIAEHPDFDGDKDSMTCYLIKCYSTDSINKPL